MKISLGSSETCERQSLQEALGVSGIEGCFKSKRRMYPSFIRRRILLKTKDAWRWLLCPIETCPNEASMHAANLSSRSRLVGSTLRKSKGLPCMGHLWQKTLVFKASIQEGKDTNEACNKKSHAQAKEAR